MPSAASRHYVTTTRLDSQELEIGQPTQRPIASHHRGTPAAMKVQPTQHQTRKALSAANSRLARGTLKSSTVPYRSAHGEVWYRPSQRRDEVPVRQEQAFLWVTRRRAQVIALVRCLPHRAREQEALRARQERGPLRFSRRGERCKDARWCSVCPTKPANAVFTSGRCECGKTQPLYAIPGVPRSSPR